MRAYCVSVSSIQQRYHEPSNSVNRPYSADRCAQIRADERQPAAQRQMHDFGSGSVLFSCRYRA